MHSQIKERDELRWAGALQDGTMQGLAALRLLLDTGINHGSRQALQRAAEDAIGQIDEEIVGLRALVAEMKRRGDDAHTSRIPRSSA